MIDEKKLIEESPEWLNPNCVGKEEYNKGWNDCNKYWCNTIERQPKVGEWIPCSERLPENDNYILLSFANFSLPLVGRYDSDGEIGGAFYIGDCDGDDTCISNDLFVNAWQPLPDPHQTKA